PSVIAAQDERIAEALSIINDQLENNEYLLGDKFSACDYFLFMLAGWSLPIKRSPMTFNHLALYLQRLSKNPTVRAVCELEEINLTPFESHS
ncbi:TPA: glutathione binding-like protein, partial [Aeromonas hydrophila]